MLVGGTHPYHGGIIPSHVILFRENDCPILTLIQLRESVPETFGIVVEGVSTLERLATWVPRSWDDMLEDALLMVGIYVLGIPELVFHAEKIFRDITNVRISDLTESEREVEEMRKILKEHIREYDIKIVLTVMLDSTILKQIPKLREYNVAFEVCVSRFRRLRDYWKGEGRLSAPIEEDYARIISGWTRETLDEK